VPPRHQTILLRLRSVSSCSSKSVCLLEEVTKWNTKEKTKKKAHLEASIASASFLMGRKRCSSAVAVVPSFSARAMPISVNLNSQPDAVLLVLDIRENGRENG